MAVLPRLRELLDGHGVPYTVLTHPSPRSAGVTARAMALPARELARAVGVRHQGVMSLAVLPSHARVDLPRLSAALRAPVELTPEPEIAAAFPECEPGAVPPFGGLYGLRTYLDESLTHDRQITFPAGTHTAAIRMGFEDYRRVAAPVVLWLAESLAGAEG